MTPDQWLAAFDVVTNITLLAAAWKASAIFSELRFKVGMMWRVFEQKFERRGDQFISRREE